MLSDDLWREFDADGDDVLSVDEFHVVFEDMRSGDVFVEPILVYPSQDARYLSDFKTLRNDALCQTFVLARRQASALPANASAWVAFYDDLMARGFEHVYAGTLPCNQTRSVDALTLDVDVNATKFTPMLVSRSSEVRMTLSSAETAVVRDENNLYESVIGPKKVVVDASGGVADLRSLGECADARAVYPRAFTFQGTSVGTKQASNIYKHPRSSRDAATFFASVQTGKYCKMAHFSIDRNAATKSCKVTVITARYVEAECATKVESYVSDWNHAYKSTNVAKSSSSHGYGMSSIALDATAMSATSQYSDIVHEFDKSNAPNVKDKFSRLLFSPDAPIDTKEIKIRHRGMMDEEFADETAAVVRGAVLFPKDWTAGSTNCGLFEATITVSEVGGMGDPQEYKTDEAGWFEIALSRGKSFVFNATFPKHSICFTGNTIADAADAVNCDGQSQTVTLERLGDGNYIFFTDVTRGNIDLGVYHGQCEEVYSDLTFKVTPINGCHPPVYVSGAEITRKGDLPSGKFFWSKQVEGLPENKFTDEDPLPDNARVWPFAAMDYSIMLDVGPNVGGIGDLISDESWKDGCATEDGDVVTFFRRRNALERLALMRDDSDWQQIRYKYHGYICVDIPDAYIPKIADDLDTCYDVNEPDGGLSKKHFLGTSTSDVNPIRALISADKSIRLKVFELHVSGDGEYKKCFQALPNESKGTGSTMIKIRQDVSDPEDSECHPQRGGGSACDFQVVLDPSGYLVFPGDDREAMTIKAGKPNLAGNFRRTVRIEVERNDLYRSVTAITNRELIPLDSKPRGGGAGFGDDTFWATVPIDGLVYTVIHDPPGGNSYASLRSGTEVSIEYTLANSRSATAGGSYSYTGDAKYGGGFGLSLNLGYTAEGGTELANAEAEAGSEIEFSVDAPEYTISSSKDDGWGITLVTERVLTSSQDPALPGRPGDAILGGGIELVYKVSDILDLSLAGENGGGVAGGACLQVTQEITWQPRQPTSYYMTVHSIEAQVLPNLRFLRATAAAGGIGEDHSGRALNSSISVSEDWDRYLSAKIEAWERTLLWSSPTDRDDVNELVSSFTGEDSIYGAHLSENVKTFKEEYEKRWDATDGPATALANEWAEGILLDLGANGPIILASLGFAAFGPTTALGPVLFGAATAGQAALVYASEARLLPYVENDVQGGSITYKRSDGVVPDYDASLKNGGTTEGFYSFGMHEAASESLYESYGGTTLISSSEEVAAIGAARSGSRSSSRSSSGNGGRDRREIGEDGAGIPWQDTSRLFASMTGADGLTAMKSGETGGVLLTFSGGGQTMDFAFSSGESVDGDAYSVGLEIGGGFELGGSYTQEVDVEKPVVAKTSGSLGAAVSFSRSVGSERAFMWNKNGQLHISYSLGDAEFGDKFVVKVGTDKRFGTPIFVTKGGRSMCPGEIGTVFRESGMSLEIPLKTKMNSRQLNPGQRAIFEVVIKNESPYREGGRFGLRLVDGLSAALSDVVSAAYAKAAEEGSTSADVIAEVSAVAASTIAKDSADVARVNQAAAKASNLSAQSVADAVYRAASKGPREAEEFGDSTFTINSKKLSVDYLMPLNFISGDALDRQKLVTRRYLNFAVEPGFATRSIDYLQLQLVSLCESDMSFHRNLYRDPISVKINVDPMSWSQPCPKVQFDESTISKYLFSNQSPSSSGELNLKVNNPDQYVLWPDDDVTDALMNERLKLVRLQYRPVSGGEWITAKDEGSPETDKKFNLLCADSRTEGCKFDWVVNNQFEKLLSGFKDNVYELRLKNFCFGGPALAESSVHEYVGDQRLTLTVDTKKPLAVNEIGFGHESFGVEFSETIDCSSQEITVTKRGEGCDDVIAGEPGEELSPEVLRSTFEFQCVNDDASASRWVVVFPRDQTPGSYVVRVRGVRDASGNVADDFQIEAVTAKGCGSRGNLGGRVSALGRRLSRRSNASAASDAALGSRSRSGSERRRPRRHPFVAFVALTLVVSTTLVGVARVAARRRARGDADDFDEKTHFAATIRDEVNDDEVNDDPRRRQSHRKSSYAYGSTL